MKTLLAQIQQRGCKEEFQPDPVLLKDGQVEHCLCLACLESASGYLSVTLKRG